MRECILLLSKTLFIFYSDQRKTYLKRQKKDQYDIAAACARVKNEVKYITNILDELFHNEYLFGDKEE